MTDETDTPRGRSPQRVIQRPRIPDTVWLPALDKTRRIGRPIGHVLAELLAGWLAEPEDRPTGTDRPTDRSRPTDRPTGVDRPTDRDRPETTELDRTGRIAAVFFTVDEGISVERAEEALTEMVTLAPASCSVVTFEGIEMLHRPGR